MLDASQVDGRVVVFGLGETQYITEDGKLAEEKNFGNMATKDNPNNFRRIVEATYKKDGKNSTYTVDSSFSAECVGIVNGYLILRERIDGRKVFIAYDHDGTVKFLLAKLGHEGDMIPIKTAYEHDGKMYVLICGAEYTAVYEITVTNK